MKEALVNLIGTYEKQYTEAGSLIGGLAGLDYEWLVSALLIMLFIYCLFRLLGGVVNG